MLESMMKLDATDFRTRGKVRFPASAIAVITLCAIIAGASGYRDFERFGNEKLAWLRTFLDLPDGIPSHDTFRYFWRNLEPARFNACFMEWVDSVCELADGDTVNIDGKVLRRALSSLGRAPCIVSAYASRERIVIGQVKTVRASRLVLEYSAANSQQPVSYASALAAECWLLNTVTLRCEASPSVFDEDHSRVRTGYGAENLAIMRHFAFDVMRLARNLTGGISCRKKTLTWNDDKMKAMLGAA